MKKKILSVITMLSVVIGMMMPVTGVQAAIGIQHEQEISLLAALDIVPGYPMDYKADAPVSRADFITYSYRAAGVEIGGAGSYISGYGWDDGSKQITVAEASRAILDAIGYKPMVEASKLDAYSFARANGMLKGVSYANADSPVTSESAVMIIYNALQLDTVEFNNQQYGYGDESVMEDLLHVYKEHGIVTANNETALNGYASVSRDHVRIGDIDYSVGRTTAAKFIGAYVDFYYMDDKDNGEYVIKWIELNTSKNERVVIYGCDITDIDQNRITFDADTGGSKTVTIAQNADIIYNGRRSDKLSVDVMRSLTCETTLINNGTSDGYNVVIINDYTYYFVDSYTASTYTVNDYSAKTSIVLDEGNYTSFGIYKDGAPADVSSIVAGQVLAVVESEDKEIIRVDILTGSVSGEITSYNDDEVTIGGITYDISPAYAGDAIKNGRNGTFYFDRLGKIVRCSSIKAQTSKYGYLMKYYSDSDGEGDFTARILTAEGSVKEFKVRDSISFNGSKKSSKDAYYQMYNGVNCEQLINYSVNAENIINSIDTADKRYIGIDVPDIDAFTINFTGAGRYRKNNMSFNSKYLVDNTTPVFLIPYNGETDEYSVQNVSYLTNNWTYDLSVYDIDDYMYASAIVIHENLIEPENLRTKRSFIVTKAVQAVDEEGEICVKLEGYQKGSKVSYYVDNPDMYDNRGKVPVASLAKGDVVQLGINTKGKINAVQLLFRAGSNTLSIASGTTSPNEYWEGGTSSFPDLWVSKGVVTDRNSTVLLVDSDGDDTVITKKPHKLGNVITYIYEHDEVSVSNKNEIAVGDNVYVHEYQGNVQEVIIVR